VLAFVSIALPRDFVRVASYNIKFLRTTVVNQGDRLDKLKKVIELLDADVIGLNEIDDRAALELLFPPAQWNIVIDDASGDDQDLALVAKKDSLKVINHRFLFPNAQDDTPFPNRRDLLCVDLQLAATNIGFSVMVTHAKSRLGGRSSTDARREGASVKIVNAIQQDFDDKDFILLGDFNDNPDDRSMNILETGDPNAIGGPEEMDGPLLINLMDHLCAEGRVSHGRTASDVVGGKINTIDPLSRSRNNLARGTDANTGDILFDQMLFPVGMSDKYVAGSVKIFDDEIAVKGSGDNVASDHLPVFAEFVFLISEPGAPAPTGIKIVALLPNPAGPDDGKEEVTIGNFQTTDLNLTGFTLRDKANNTFPLAGMVPALGKLTIVMTSNSMPLNNNGDEVTLLDPQGTPKDKVSYTAANAQSGKVINSP